MGVANDVQVLPKTLPNLTMSVMSTKPSGGSGAISYRVGAEGTGLPNLVPTAVMSEISENVSLLISAGQALSLESCAQALKGSVPIVVSALSVQPSPSLSPSANAGDASPRKAAEPTVKTPFIATPRMTTAIRARGFFQAPSPRDIDQPARDKRGLLISTVREDSLLAAMRHPA